MIEVEDLWKSYRRVKERFLGIFPRRVERVEALKGISFRVEKGELLGYLGPNGSGKSTTIKILTGVLHPDRGKVEVAGFIPWERRREFLEAISVMFGHRGFLFWEIPVIDTFLFYKEVYGIDDETFDDRLGWLSNVLEIEEYLERPARELSLGERIRCELALALLHDPEIIFLDEPFLGIDVWSREKIRSFMKELGKMGKTVFLSSHQLEDVEEIVERVILLSKGEIVFDGSLRELKEYIPWKRVVVLLPEGVEPRNYVVKREGRSYELKVPKEVVKEVVEELLAMGALDIVVEEPDLEEVVKHVISAA